MAGNINKETTTKKNKKCPAWHFYCNQRLYSRRWHWLAHCQTQKCWSAKYFNMILAWNKNLQTISPLWHTAAHPRFSVHILTCQKDWFWSEEAASLCSQPLACRLMREEMDCCRENSDWIRPHIHPASSTGNAPHCILLYYCILYINSDWVWPWHTTAFTESGDRQSSG